MTNKFGPDIIFFCIAMIAVLAIVVFTSSSKSDTSKQQGSTTSFQLQKAKSVLS